MFAHTLLRTSSQAMSAVMGGMAVFCIYCACRATDHDFILHLIIEALKWGGFASAIVYFQGKYLDK